MAMMLVLLHDGLAFMEDQPLYNQWTADPEDQDQWQMETQMTQSFRDPESHVDAEISTLNAASTFPNYQQFFTPSQQLPPQLASIREGAGLPTNSVPRRSPSQASPVQGERSNRPRRRRNRGRQQQIVNAQQALREGRSQQIPSIQHQAPAGQQQGQARERAGQGQSQGQPQGRSAESQPQGRSAESEPQGRSAESEQEGREDLGDTKYFMYAHSPGDKGYEFGYRRGDDNHFKEHYEMASANHNFKTKVRWGDRKGGYGEHYWDYNHGKATEGQAQHDGGHQPGGEGGAPATDAQQQPVAYGREQEGATATGDEESENETSPGQEPEPLQPGRPAPGPFPYPLHPQAGGLRAQQQQPFQSHAGFVATPPSYGGYPQQSAPQTNRLYYDPTVLARYSRRRPIIVRTPQGGPVPPAVAVYPSPNELQPTKVKNPEENGRDGRGERRRPRNRRRNRRRNKDASGIVKSAKDRILEGLGLKRPADRESGSDTTASQSALPTSEDEALNMIPTNDGGDSNGLKPAESQRQITYRSPPKQLNKQTISRTIADITENFERNQESFKHLQRNKRDVEQLKTDAIRQLGNVISIFFH